MGNNDSIQKLSKDVGEASTIFEKTNTELKRKYLLWNIEAFNVIASAVSVGRGTFGTGYPFYALDSNLCGEIPIIQEQIRYNRELIKNGEPYQQSIWKCKNCLKQNYEQMPDLKILCKPCPKVPNALKPRKFINRLPDLDMWLVCEDGCVKTAERELTILLEKFGMRTSDIDPLLSIEEVKLISQKLKEGEPIDTFLPIDIHIIEYSKLKKLIEQVPEVLRDSRDTDEKPYLPIQPKSYRKKWQYDDVAYNYIYDFLSAFTEFNFPEELQKSLNESRKIVATENSPSQLFEFLMDSATAANQRRFETVSLENIFMKKIQLWKKMNEQSYEDSNIVFGPTKEDISCPKDDYQI